VVQHHHRDRERANAVEARPIPKRRTCRHAEAYAAPSADATIGTSADLQRALLDSAVVTGSRLDDVAASEDGCVASPKERSHELSPSRVADCVGEGGGPTEAHAHDAPRRRRDGRRRHWRCRYRGRRDDLVYVVVNICTRLDRSVFAGAEFGERA
jgi:hypothetical protein